VRRQHGVISHQQLRELGFSDKAIRARVKSGRLHRIYRGVYAVGRPDLTQHGRWMAAVLACGPGTALSYDSGAALWGIRKPRRTTPIHVSIPLCRRSSHEGIVVHRRAELNATRHEGIPVTTPIDTLIDLAATLNESNLEAAVNEADKLDLVHADALRKAVEGIRRPGAGALHRLLGEHAFTATDSELERMLLRIARRAGLPKPQTGVVVNGFKVDFYWPEYKLVVETDGLRYHRTPAQQAKDRLRDQVHIAAGLIPLRFTAAQVTRDAAYVERTLSATAARA
jgi:very-short-patch-repair endonuclease